MTGRVIGHNSERGQPKHFTKVWFQLAKQFHTTRFFNDFFAKFSIFSKGGHLGWRVGSSDTILKGDHPRTIPIKFGLVSEELIKMRKAKTDDDDGQQLRPSGSKSSHDPSGQVSLQRVITDYEVRLMTCFDSYNNSSHYTD